MGEKQATQQQWQIEHNTNSNYSYGTKCATDLLLIAKIVYTLFIVYILYGLNVIVTSMIMRTNKRHISCISFAM